MERDLRAGKPLVAHVVVALCDNASQGIVPVSAELGNGDVPRTNLYWGALYGVKTYFSGKPEWQKVTLKSPDGDAILERVAFKSVLDRNGKPTEVYVVADAWRGKNIRQAIRRYLEYTAGDYSEQLRVEHNGQVATLNAGGGAQLHAYVGHNGLMEFSLPAMTLSSTTKGASSAIILACTSKTYFDPHLYRADAHSLLTTTGLMAPEAYTLEAAIKAWFTGASAEVVRDTAAKTYAGFQQANPAWARRLFSFEP